MRESIEQQMRRQDYEDDRRERSEATRLRRERDQLVKEKAWLAGALERLDESLSGDTDCPLCDPPASDSVGRHREGCIVGDALDATTPEDEDG